MTILLSEGNLKSLTFIHREDADYTKGPDILTRGVPWTLEPLPLCDRKIEQEFLCKLRWRWETWRPEIASKKLSLMRIGNRKRNVEEGQRGEGTEVLQRVEVLEEDWGFLTDEMGGEKEGSRASSVDTCDEWINC
jgi:hypothetical protein